MGCGVMKPGEIYLFTPFQLDHNPIVKMGRKSMVGIFLEKVIDHSGWRPSRFKVLGPEGVEELWNNQWACDPVPEFVGEE